jgi:predicted nucleic acid-binding protein
VTRIPAFWDTSALVPLCIRQDITPGMIAVYRSYDVVIWWAAPVEIASALARLTRMKQINSSEWAKAKQLAQTLSDSWGTIQPSDKLCAKAIQLVERYDLHSADSLQLAAALEWCENMPNGRVFLTADEKLRAAALLAGFDAKHLRS